MKMKNNNIRIAADNNHLLDIFTDNYYLELGNIDFDTINKILNNKVVKVEEIADFKNQNLGIGGSDINHEGFRTIFPYIFIDNINRNDESLQIFITYGLALYIDQEKKQKFAPLVLIPVNIFFEDGACLFKIVGNPIANSIFIEYLRSNGFAAGYLGHDYNIYGLQKYCASFNRFDGIEVKTDNYLTFGSVIQPQAILNHDKFDLKIEFINFLGNKAYREQSNRIYNITPLDNRQRLAVQRAAVGNSFGITGFLGTGKTTALINIASDSIARDKKVLYLSNVKETLQRVEKVFSSHYLSGLLLDLTKSPRSMIIGNSLIEKHRSEELDEETIINTLLNNYQVIDEYENNLSKRIYNFRFIDVLKEMVSVKKPEVDYSIDSVDGIYKHEYQEIIEALAVIDEKMKKIESFKKSKFINIPINHRIKYPNQIMTLLFQLNKSFKDLQSYRNILGTSYQFKDIKNYAMFKNVINNILGCAIDRIPDSWKSEDLLHFRKAIEVYPEIKRLVYAIQEMELYLDWDYQDYQDFDIDDAVKKIYGPYFSIDNKDRIDNIIENIVQIRAKLHVGKYSSDNFNEQLTRIKNIFEWDFKEEKEIEFIVKVIHFLNHNYISNKWFDQHRFNSLRKDIRRLKMQLDSYTSLKNALVSVLGEFSDITQEIIAIDRYINTKKIPKKFANSNLHELRENLIKYRDIHPNIRKLKYDYYTVTGREYSASDDMLLAFDTWTSFIKTINNKAYVNKLINFLSHINPDYYQNFLNDLNKFLRIYNATNKIYQYICEIIGEEIELTSLEKVEKINEFVQYISELNEIYERMKGIVKDKKAVINFDAFLLLQKKIKQLNETKNKIIGNHDYQFLYGSLFEDARTNVNDLANFIKYFSNYIDCFTDDGAVVNSLKPVKFQEINDIIRNAEVAIYEINESFKLYNKIFKNGVGDYYYDDIADNIKYLDSLLNAKDELIAYLEITDKLKVLVKYKLFILNNLIIENKINNLVALFKYKYFQNIYHIFMVDHNFLDSDKLNLILNDIIQAENDLIKINIEHLQNLKAAKTIYTNPRHNTYRDYVRRTSKSLFLANTKVLNYNLNINDFDIVLIDDAQFLYANEYYKAVQGKQIIIAGDNTTGTTVFPNLIARMRNNNLMSFNYRYQIAPLSLIDNLPDTLGQFYPEVVLNNGVEISNKDEIVTISELFLENENYTINCYVKTLSQKRLVSEGVVKYLLANRMNDNVIYDIIRNRLNIIDFKWLYSESSDFNIVNTNDILAINAHELGENNIRNILLAKVKVIIIDKDNVLSNGNGSIKNNLFFSKVFKDNQYTFKPINSIILNNLANDLSNLGIIVCGSYGELGLVLESQGLYFGIMFYSDPDKSHFDILEDYRRYYINSQKHHFEIINIWILDLVNNYDGIIKRIREIVNYEFK